MIVPIPAFFDLAYHRAAAMTAGNEATKRKAILGLMGFLQTAAAQNSLDCSHSSRGTIGS